ncbi:MAG TPA: TorF family putative porin [Sphingomonas sp.]|nr:TorF family putative porin [Sphingomonas sp.]
MPATAAITGDITLLSDDLYRGKSVSGGRPVARLGFAYEDLSGPYAGATASVVHAPGGEVQLLSVVEYAGVAQRLWPELTIDLGVMHTDYSRYWSGSRGTHYVEVYAGLIARRFNARISLSPDYLRPGWRAAYGEANATLASNELWDVSLHGGLFAWVAGGRPPGANRARYDWQISGGRKFGRFQIRAGWAGVGPQPDYYRGARRGHGTATVSISAAL